MTRKAIILAGGMGTRMQKKSEDAEPLDEETERLADRGLKGLIPINGQPFLDYVLGSLFAVDIEEICLVIPPGNDELQSYIEDAADRSGKNVTWAVQEKPLGTADALMSARNFAGDEPFIMSNCDNIYPESALAQLAQSSPECPCVMAFDRESLVKESNFGRERVRRFAVVVADDNGCLQSIMEKPRHPEHYERNGRLWLSMNLYRFTPAIFEACERIEPDPDRGELELPTAVLLLAQEREFQVAQCRGGVIDMTGRDDIPAVRELLDGVDPGF